MPTVFVLGAGAPMGATPGGTRFPSVSQLLERVREAVCGRDNSLLPALTLYLNRFAPAKSMGVPTGKLQTDWDRINVEDLYAAIEFESRISAHLMLPSGDKGSGTRFYQEYFPEPYQQAVTQLLRGPYRGWMETCYSAPYGSEAFPMLFDPPQSNAAWVSPAQHRITHRSSRC
ncbi:MAG: hypothetical protein FJ291_15425 [Planctomycetes bacterium]|nr:hypothetical protein [Planctomycetota bacterium]